MADEKVKQAWWSDTTSQLLTKPPKKFGDEVTGIFDNDRLDQLEKVGKISFEKPESEEKADISKTAQLEKSLREATEYIQTLESGNSKVGKAAEDLKKAKAEIKKLKAAASGDDSAEVTKLKKEADDLLDELDTEQKNVKYLTEMINAMEPDWKPGKDGK